MAEDTQDLIEAFLLKGGKVTTIKRQSGTLSQRDWKRLQRCPEADRAKLELEIRQEHAMKRALGLKKLTKKMRA